MAEVDPSRLIAALADIERHVSELGWDQPARLFALVETATLLELEPNEAHFKAALRFVLNCRARVLRRGCG